jgi:hypothetical protein
MPTENKRFQIRRGTAAQWTTSNPVLAAGEQGFETDTRKSKVGDGTTAWTSLAYTDGGDSGNSIGTIVIVTDPALPGNNTVVPGVQAVREHVAAALGNDANFAATTATALGNRLVRASNLSDLTNIATARANLQLAAARTRTMVFNFDGGSSAPATGLTGEFSVPVAGTITRAKLLLDAAGSAVVDVRKGTFAGGAPVASICASAKPTLSSARRAIAPLTGWTLAFNADDMFVANLESASGFTKGVLVIEYEAN